MFKRRTIVAAFVVSPITGYSSVWPYVLSENNFDINMTVLRMGWFILAVSALVFLYSFLSLAGSLTMYAFMSLPGGLELLQKTGNPYRLFAWKEAIGKYEELLKTIGPKTSRGGP